MQDQLGDRMKNYENVFNPKVDSNLPIIVRLDGRSFSNFTRNFEKPYCPRFINIMKYLTNKTMQEFSFKYSYCQSDEISLIWWKDRPEEQFVFDGKINKINSVAASYLSVEFNQCLFESEKIGLFDCRTFNVPSKAEVVNYLVWRSKDCYRNAVTRVAQLYYSHKQLQGKSTAEKLEMINQYAIENRTCNFDYWEKDFKYGVSQNRVEKRSPLLLFDNFFSRYFEIFGEMPDVDVSKTAIN